ncbi:helix-turn-helix domain-containing protein [Paenibacillus spongiae]|uniref:Helix-turn-helix domain-containing protein n=1 Tax=Paenibacillus spongiae TaxID=2909671 RepID=A0ABY5SA58_9BACL|nr:helix-turn-helix domain-containing protein [Paenibacillus spongiae]UVI30619.1 helix-turn-helix domain-containing protein [Paenibacillus spongiae]
MKKSWFRRLLFSYLPAFFGVIMILFVVFFQYLNEQNHKEAIKANEFMVQQVIRYTDSTLKAIDYKVARLVMTDPTVTRFFNLDYNDVFANIQAVKVMDDLKVNFPLIDSVYFVRLKDGGMLGDAPSKLADFPDADFIAQSNKRQVQVKWTGERKFTPYADSPSKNVITLVRDVPYFSSQKKGYFVVNVSVSALRDSIAQMYNGDITFVRMTDGQGHDLLAKAAGEGEAGRQFSSFTSPYTGWLVESGLIDTGMIGFALNLYNVWMIMALVSVVLGVVWVILVTRKNYRPIQQIVSLLRTNALQNQGSDGGPSESEMGFIQASLEQMIEETEQFRQQHRQSLILQKKYRFQEVMEGLAPIKEAEWISELKKYDLDVAGRTALVQMFEIDGYHQFSAAYNQRDQSLLRFTLFVVVLEVVQNHSASVWSEWTTDRRLTSIIWAPEGADPGEIQDAISQAVLQWVEQNLSFTVTIGQGGQALTLEEIRQSYEKAGNLLQYKAVLGANRIIHPEQIAKPQTEIHEYFKTINQLSQSVRLSGPEWRGHLAFLFGQIRDSLSSRKEIDSLMLFLQQHLDREFLDLSKEYRQMWKATQVELLELAKQWETLEELEDGCARIFETAVERMQALRESHGSRAVIAEIRCYIEEHYGNPDLSLDYLSEKFQLNAKNVSKLFKDEFGENFVDFLIGLRMKRAQDLLAQTQKSMQEISLEVGYYNYNSFNRAFKNVSGLSPRDYRKQATNDAG